MNKQSGFTLMELVVVIALVAIFAAVAVPSYRNLVADNRITSALNAFAGTLAEARSEAVSRGETVVICPSSDATSSGTPSCATQGTGTADWGAGWITYMHSPTNTNSTYEYDPSQGDKLLQVHGAVNGLTKQDTSHEQALTLRSPSGKGSVANYIGFNRMGFAQPTFSGTMTGLGITACPYAGADAKRAHAIVLELSGSVRSATDTTSSGVVDVPAANQATQDVSC